MKEYCAECCEKTEVEEVDPDNASSRDVFCLSCGAEFTLKSAQEKKYSNYAIGKVTSVEAVGGKKKSLKKVAVLIKGNENNQDNDDRQSLSVVTNAKHVEIGNRVVVAKPGAIVPAGSNLEEAENAFEVMISSVGGVKSEGILCDCPMLGWTGGAAGVLVKLNESFKIGDMPPMERPRQNK